MRKRIDRSRTEGIESDVRGMTSLLGALLILVVVLIGVGAMTVGGYAGLSGSAQEANILAAEEDLKAIQTNIEAIGTGPSTSERVELTYRNQFDDGAMGFRESGEIEVSVGSEDVLEETFGTVEYVQGDSTAVYQNGAVLNHYADRTPTMVSSPSISSSDRGRELSLTLPVFTIVEGSTQFNQGALIQNASEPRIKHYDKIYVEDGDEIQIRIESEYASAWTRWFEDEMEREIEAGNAEVSMDGDVVTVDYGANQEVYLHLNEYRVTMDAR